MTTSNVVAWSINRDEIIKQALELVGGLGEDQTPTDDQLTRAIPVLNNVIKLFAADGMPVWKRSEATFLLDVTQRVYTIPDGWKPVQAFLISQDGSVQYELNEKSVQDFNMLPFNSTGSPNAWVAIPYIDHTDVAVWPTPDYGSTLSKYLCIIYQEQFDIFTNSNDTPDFPDYYFDPIIYALATRLAPRYGLPIRDRQLLIQEAKDLKATADMFNNETASLFIQPDRMRS